MASEKAQQAPAKPSNHTAARRPVASAEQGVVPAASPAASSPKPRLASSFWTKAEARRAPISASFRRYSRFVGRAKLILPLSAAALIVAVAAWPYFSAGLSKLRTPVAAPTASQIAEVRMLAPHYIGTDRQQRPFSLTAKMARQTGDSDDLMALDAPHADLKANNGSQVTVSGDSGIYQSQAHFLDLKGNVTLSQDKGYSFHTDAARVDLENGSSEGHDPVTGGGPNGHITAEGFRAEQGGQAIMFTGHTNLVVDAAGKKS
ncbi:MAG TPA: LPS export ABC transporter periplasmic protein LptC [Stellaceae bacterium]|nr:LPS export ABC transporter periplasmic protein LptC [Stellaceae bacterium]